MNIPTLTSFQLKLLHSAKHNSKHDEPRRWCQTSYHCKTGDPKPNWMSPDLLRLQSLGFIEVHPEFKVELQDDPFMVDAWVCWEIADQVDFEGTQEEWDAFRQDYQDEWEDPVPETINTFPEIWVATYFYRLTEGAIA